MDTHTAAHTHLLGSYRADGVERQVLALEDHASDVLQMVDVLATPVDGDFDRRQVENRITCLGEAQAIADDYLPLAERLGYPPMPDGWW
jgi:hypothetical protein